VCRQYRENSRKKNIGVIADILRDGIWATVATFSVMAHLTTITCTPRRRTMQAKGNARTPCGVTNWCVAPREAIEAVDRKLEIRLASRDMNGHGECEPCWTIIDDEADAL
jgi:hypothetical protein